MNTNNCSKKVIRASPRVSHINLPSYFFWQTKKKRSPRAWQTDWQIYQLGKSSPPSAHICARAYGFASREKPAARLFLSPVRHRASLSVSRASSFVIASLLLLTESDLLGPALNDLSAQQSDSDDYEHGHTPAGQEFNSLCKLRSLVFRLSLSVSYPWWS